MLKNDFYRSVPRCVVERRIEGKTEEVGKAKSFISINIVFIIA